MVGQVEFGTKILEILLAILNLKSMPKAVYEPFKPVYQFLLGSQPAAMANLSAIQRRRLNGMDIVARQ